MLPEFLSKIEIVTPSVDTSPDADDALPDAVLDDVLPFDPHPASIPAPSGHSSPLRYFFELHFLFSFYHQLFTDPSMIPLTKYF